MNSFATLAQALGIAYATGINLYATVAIVGLAERLGWIGPLPGSLSVVANPVIIGLAAVLYLFEFLATLIPGVASAWETFHSLIRPPAAAGLAAATAWHGDAVLVLAAALLGGSLAVVTHTTKLGLRYAIDTSPEPLTNGASPLGDTRPRARDPHPADSHRTPDLASVGEGVLRPLDAGPRTPAECSLFGGPSSLPVASGRLTRHR